MSDTDRNKADWVRRVLGVNVTTGTPGQAAPSTNGGAPPKQVRFAPMTESVVPPAPPQPIGPGLRPRREGGAPPPVRPAVPVGPKTTFSGAGGKKMEVVIGTDGKVALTAPKPPVQEITFSGGGGKGSALPGAVAALQASGVLKEVKVLNGASVGSMTAALLAAGITSEDFETVSNDPKTGERISEGRGRLGMLLKGIAATETGGVIGSRMSGDELENIVREQMGASLRKQVAAYVASGNGRPDDIAAAQAIADKTSRGGGVTFADLKTLSAFVPGIKEVVISATMMGDDSGTPGKIEKGKPQLAIFSADTEPDMDVARAVHASAALPPVFDPVNVRLSSGVTAQFEDGGVMNNAPTSGLVGAKRSLDPIPQSGEMTFVFEDDASKEVLEGRAKPKSNWVNDHFSAAPNAVADYTKNRGLADKPEDVVMVPLTFVEPGKNGKKGKEKSFTGLWGGTVNMSMSVEDKQQLQAATALETLRQIDKRQLPETRKFDSPKQMLNCICEADLSSLAAQGFPGAQEELDFRRSALDIIATLTKTAKGAKAAALTSGPVRDALDVLNGLAEGDEDREGFVARELNRSGALDPLLTLAKETGESGIGVLDAGVAVADALAAKAHAQVILREVVYPKMIEVKPKSVAGGVLSNMDAILRAAMMPDDVNDSLQIGIAFFEQKTGLRKRPRDAEFASQLASYKMQAA